MHREFNNCVRSSVFFGILGAMRLIVPRLCILFGIAMCGSPTARAADPQSYKVDIASTGERPLDDTLKATSDLQALRSSAPVGPFGLIARARSDIDRLKTVLESFGYYQSVVTIKIDGTPITDVGLGDALSALPKGKDARVAIGFTLGPLYRLGKIAVDGTLPDSQGVEALGLNTGQPAVASVVLAAGTRLLTTLQEKGYAFAKVDAPVAIESLDAPVLDVSFHVDAGPRVKIGGIHIEGLKRLHEKLLRSRLLLHTGDLYSPVAIERARRDLMGLVPIAAISVQLGTAIDDQGGVSVTFQVRERLRHAVTINAAYSSDLGGSGGVTWSDRNVFGNAEQLNVSASVLNLGGSATTGLGYDASVKYIVPDVWRPDQSVQIAVGAIKQSLEAYDQTARTSGVTLNRKLSKTWSASVGISTADEQVLQEGITHDYTLIALPVSVSYDSTNLSSPLDDPSHGMRDTLSIAPTRAFGHGDANFVISQIKLAAYLDLNVLHFSDPGRSVIAARLLAGLAEGAGEFSLPPDQRFYGGGSGTIRGYRYQAVGPQFVADGNPVGGTSIFAGSLEWRQRIGASWGAAVFVDGGEVRAATIIPPPEVTTIGVRIGVGAGVRYYTPIGPVRLDIALPTKHYSTDDDAFEVYIGLGQAF